MKSILYVTQELICVTVESDPKSLSIMFSTRNQGTVGMIEVKSYQSSVSGGITKERINNGKLKVLHRRYPQDTHVPGSGN